jgi:hypothetical protein
MSSQSYPLRVPTGLLALAELKSKDERTDRSTALRQWLYTGAEDYVIELLSRGRLSVARAAELLDMTVSDLHALAAERDVEIGATGEQTRMAIETARRIVQAG